METKIKDEPFEIVWFNEPYKRDIFKHGHAWGPWVLDAEVLALNYEVDGNFIYGVDIERIHTSWHVLDWICQIADKQLARTNPDDMAMVTGYLAIAMNDIFRPQNALREDRNRTLKKMEIDGVSAIEALA